MEKENIFGQMGQYMKDNFLKDLDKGLEPLKLQIIVFILVNFNKIRRRENAK